MAATVPPEAAGPQPPSPPPGPPVPPEAAGPHPPPDSSAPAAAVPGAVADPADGRLSRRVLGSEVVLVLALSLGASGLYAALDLLQGLITSAQPLAQQSTTLYAPAAPQVWLDISYQVLGLATGLAPVFLVAYLLMRSGESMATIGVDATRPAEDTRWSVVLALLVGGVGLGGLFAAKWLGINRNLIVGGGAGRWWDVVLLVFQAAGTAISEEVIVGGYLLHRFRQLGWGDGTALVVASLVRGSYHLYQGFGGAAANFVLGLFFGRIFQRRGRVMPMLVAHFLIDAVAFVGYVELKPHVSWLP
jgi:membrane protease YdiL (CAAX protease family)